MVAFRTAQRYDFPNMAQSIEIGPFSLIELTVSSVTDSLCVLFAMSLMTPVLVLSPPHAGFFYGPASSWFFCAQPQPGSAFTESLPPLGQRYHPLKTHEDNHG